MRRGGGEARNLLVINDLQRIVLFICLFSCAFAERWYITLMQTKEEIERMVQDAEANAESDQKARGLIEARNTAEAQIHSIRRDMEEVTAELSQEVKDKVEEAIKAVNDAVVAEDKDAIIQKLSDLSVASQPVTEAKNKRDEAKKNETPVDAEFTEVN